MAVAGALPILINLGKFLATYGPLVLQFLVQSGVLRLPPGVALPDSPALPGDAAAARHFAALHPLQAELDLEALTAHAGQLNRLYLDAVAGHLANNHS